MIEIEQISKAALILNEAQIDVSSLLGRHIRLLVLYEDGSNLSEELIIQTVSDVTGISTSLLMSDARKQEVLFGRYICWTLLKRLLGLGQVAIGDIFGKDHSTISNGLKKAGDEYFTNRDYKVAYDKCLEETIRRIR